MTDRIAEVETAQRLAKEAGITLSQTELLEAAEIAIDDAQAHPVVLHEQADAVNEEAPLKELTSREVVLGGLTLQNIFGVPTLRRAAAHYALHKTLAERRKVKDQQAKDKPPESV